jgi:hypothetical protein
VGQCLEVRPECPQKLFELNRSAVGKNELPLGF